MRKEMCKKGFSLTELVVVVAIMGIVAVAAVPLYTIFIENSNNKTCSSNIEVIKASASSYYSAYGQTGVPNLDALRKYIGRSVDKIPPCPLATVITDGEHEGEAVEGEVYKIYVQLNGSVKVVCPFNNPDGTVEGLKKHNPNGVEAVGWTPTGTLLQ